MSNNDASALKQVESIEHTCATCDHYVDGWDGRHRMRCGLCWLKWQNIADCYELPRLGIDAASVCVVDGSQICDEWVGADDD